MAYGKFIVKSMGLARDMQQGLDCHLNVFGAQLFAESLEWQREEVQKGGITLITHDHNGKVWYVTATTTPPEIIQEDLPPEEARLD